MGSLALEETYWDEVVLERSAVVNGGEVAEVVVNLRFLRMWVAIDEQSEVRKPSPD